MVRIGNHIAVIPDFIEHREAIKCERTNTAGRFIFGAVATDRYENYEGQGVWNSVSSQPPVTVFIDGTAVKAKFLSDSSENELPAIKLKTISSLLLNEHTAEYIKINDYNDDGYHDIAVLKSIGNSGGKKCYSVFPYKPDYFSFSSRPIKTVCIN